MTKRIYLAGPLFTLAEIEFNEKLAAELETLGYSIFLPQVACASKELSEIGLTCRKGIDESDVIVAILDGADADSGTCWECGYGYAKNKPVIGIRTDFRKSGDTEGFNAMLYYGCARIVLGTNKIANLIDKHITELFEEIL